MPTPTPSPAAPACRPPGCVRTLARSSTVRSVGTRTRWSSSPARVAPRRSTSWSPSLGYGFPRAWTTGYHLDDTIAAPQRPVVFIGPFEHDCNELPWRESVADVVVIAQDGDGHIDSDAPERKLVRYAARPLLIGS